MIDAEDRQHLMNMLNAIEEIESYMEGEEYNDFLKDDSVREAVARQLQDVGGAAKMLSDDFRSQYGDIDWEVLIRLQDAMYNQSVEYEFQSLWEIIKDDFPEIKSQIADIASNAEEEEDIQGTLPPELNIPEEGQFKP